MLPNEVKSVGDHARARRKRVSRLESIQEQSSNHSVSAATTIEDALASLDALIVKAHQAPILTSPSQLSETPCPPKEKLLYRRNIARQKRRRRIIFSPVRPLQIRKSGLPVSDAAQTKKLRRNATILSNMSLSPQDLEKLRQVPPSNDL